MTPEQKRILRYLRRQHEQARRRRGWSQILKDILMAIEKKGEA